MNVPGTSYITSKKQLLGNKPPRPVKRFAHYKQPTSTVPANLAPPTNLTTQDIMDLPIIFADDNQVLDAQEATPPPPPQPVTPTVAPPSKFLSSGSKYVFVNKPASVSQSNTHFVISQASSSKKPTTVFRQTPKYTKIILSTRNDESKSTNVVSKIANLSSEISVKKVSGEHMDLENELVATSIPKPGFRLEGGLSLKMVNRQGDGFVRTVEKMKDGHLRRTFPSLVNEEDDDSDPDYIPPKMVKLN